MIKCKKYIENEYNIQTEYILLKFYKNRLKYEHNNLKGGRSSKHAIKKGKEANLGSSI